MTAAVCGKTDRNARLVDYLKQEKRLRESIQDSTVLADSLAELQKQFSIDIEEELFRLRQRPKDWPVLLRKLRSG